MTSIRAAAFNEHNGTPGLGTVGTNLVTFQIHVRDRRIFLQRLGQGLEAARDPSLRLLPELYRSTAVY